MSLPDEGAFLAEEARGYASRGVDVRVALAARSFSPWIKDTACLFWHLDVNAVVPMINRRGLSKDIDNCLRDSWQHHFLMGDLLHAQPAVVLLGDPVPGL